MSFTVHLTHKSANAKVGPIPVSTTEESSCPDTCPLKKGGCYAKSGPLSLHWRKVPERGMSWESFCVEIRNLPHGQLWRHNQAGDLPHVDGVIDHLAMGVLVGANFGKKGFTYTHHDMTKEENRSAVEIYNQMGFTINLSANTVSEADKYVSLAIAPVCVVLPSDATKNFKTPAGNRVVVCPSAVKDDVTCETCKLCANTKRKVIIGFPAHGTQKKKATAVSQGT